MSDTKRKRVLMVSCHFPPVGGAGVQRPAKFVKYLRQHGWEPTVLTVENPSVPAFDDSLLKDIPDDVRIVKARTWEPGYQAKANVSANTDQKSSGILSRLKGRLRKVARSVVLTALQPDPQVLWLPNAKKVARKVLKETPHDAIFVTAPPYSAMLLGRKLSKEFGLPLALDFRDEWDMSSKYLENGQRDWYSTRVQSRMQRNVLRAADAVIGTTPESANRLRTRVQESGGDAFSECIYNGFDPEDFAELPTRDELRSDDRFRIVYTGTLWNLTDVSGLINGVELFCELHPALASRLEMIFVGRKTTEQQAILDRLNSTDVTLTLRDYCPHSEALEIMASADALALLLADVPGAERVMPAKAFEYLALQRSILGVLPAGACDSVIRPFCPESTFAPSELDRIAEWIAGQIRLKDRVETSHDSELLKPYLRENQTAQLAEVLDSIVKRRERADRTSRPQRPTAEVQS